MLFTDLSGSVTYSVQEPRACALFDVDAGTALVLAFLGCNLRWAEEQRGSERKVLFRRLGIVDEVLGEVGQGLVDERQVDALTSSGMRWNR